MAKLNLDYYNNDSGYSDGDIEQELLEIVKNNSDYEEVLKDDNRWPIHYHLSPRRENIFSWYPFKEDAEILEIGSGCGALTNLLTKKAKAVTSVELTKPRADVNFERNKDKENLEIFVGNFNNMDFDKKFDYIILNGVLEYAISFTDSENPFEDFLELIKSHLKDDGEILIAIENRLGLKYFNGVPEDHTAQLFSGLDGYPYTNNVRTFSKKELTDLLNRVNLKGTEFYYPNPDYKFPNTIYTDETVNMVDSRVETNTFNVNRVRFFDESNVLKSFLDEGIADRFFNSFLVVASREPKTRDEKVIFSKYSDKRRKPYQTKTSIIEENNVKKVVKEPLNKEAENHIRNMANYYQNNPKNGKFENVYSELRDDGAIVFDFVKGDTYEERLLKLLREGNYEGFEGLLKEFSDELYKDSEMSQNYQTEEFKDIFGPALLDVPLHVKKNSNIDLIFSNIIGENNTIIDYEWIFDFDVPQEFIIWRSLYYFILNNNLNHDLYNIEKLMELVGIDPDLHETFKKWDEYFGNVTVLEDEDTLLTNVTVDAVPILSELIQNNDTTSSLYLDFGKGHSEEFRVLRNLKLNNYHFEVSFNLKDILESAPGRIKHIRWDPVEQACRIRNLKVSSNTGEVNIYKEAITSRNRIGDNGWIYFFSNDPQVDILGNYEGLKDIKITGELQFLTANEILEVASELNGQIQTEEIELSKLTKAIHDKDQHIKNLENIIAQISNGTL